VLLWLKAFHIIVVVCWFAGIFYLPRLFVNYAMSDEPVVQKQLAIMARKLYRFTSIFAWLTVLFGTLLTCYNAAYYFSQTWFIAKLCLVVILIVYHLSCGRMVKIFEQGNNQRSHVFYRWFNEMPVFILFGVVILVIVRPFS
jgi:putative membrane protein